MAFTARQTLDALQRAIARRDPELRLQTTLHLTKTAPALSHALLVRDLPLEQAVARFLDDRLGGNLPGATPGYVTLVQKYLDYGGPDLRSLAWPQHVPARLVAASGPLATGRNVFLFFPDAVGLRADRPEDVLGIELVDIGDHVLDQCITPLVQAAFTPATQAWIFRTLAGKHSLITYLASVFHEIGHRVGPLRVSPQPDPRNRLSKFELDTLGELSTDTLLVTNLHAFPEVLLYVLLTRMFWYARQGFAEDPRAASINQDNDALTGAFLWQRLESLGALTQQDHQWRLDPATTLDALYRVRAEVHGVATAALDLPTTVMQDAVVRDFLVSHVPTESVLEDSSETETRSEVVQATGPQRRERFVLPEGLREIFERVGPSIPEWPRFLPPLRLEEGEELPEDIASLEPLPERDMDAVVERSAGPGKQHREPRFECALGDRVVEVPAGLREVTDSLGRRAAH